MPFHEFTHTLRYFNRLERIATINASLSMDTMESGSDMDDNLMQCLNVLCRMIVIESGNTTELSDLQS